MRVAVLDDDQAQLDLAQQTLEGMGHDVHCFGEGKSLLRALRRETFDLLILDWQLPDISGLEVMRWARQNLEERVPVLFVTNRSGEADVIEGLSAGADDYMIKPARAGELTARVNALLRRAYPQKGSGEFVIDRYRFDPSRAHIHIGEQTVVLKQKEFDLAVFLFRNIGRLLSRKHLLEAVWSIEAEVSSRSLDTHVSRLRSKLGIVPENGYRLVAIYSVGYRLETVLPGTAGQDSRYAAGAPYAA
ncbi:MAG TPA: response regulator transcription factor [Burkholderiaceae bacterium]|nr:response regulator transcription factor [Burkholderiaceae bacterium]